MIRTLYWLKSADGLKKFCIAGSEYKRNIKVLLQKMPLSKACETNLSQFLSEHRVDYDIEINWSNQLT